MSGIMDDNDEGQSQDHHGMKINVERNRYPYSVVWTPIPLLTWIFPFIGHMGIAMSSGVIRDFAGPYFVSEDDMAFGNPTKYWQLNPVKVNSLHVSWDSAISSASEEYLHRMHNLCCDNCHSHVAMALNLMEYNGWTNWNMVYLCFIMLLKGRYVSLFGFLKTWLPFLIMVSLIVCLVVFFRL